MNSVSVYVVDYNRKFLVLQWEDPTTGKRRSQSSKCTSRREAERAASKLEARLNSLRPNGDGLTLWGDFIRFYTDEHLAGLADKTFGRQSSALNIFAETMQPQVIRSVTASILTKYAAEMRDIGRAQETITAHLSALRTALRWGYDNGYSSEVPKFPRMPRVKGRRSKGRPLTDAEFKRFDSAVTENIVGDGGVPSWSRLLNGLWLSGLRLEEALLLRWGGDMIDEDDLWIDTTGKFPLLGIKAESEKGRQDRLLPITPDFGKWLLKTPKNQRKGFVFPLIKQRYKDSRNSDHVSKLISKIGKASGVIVNSKGKFASAQDLRRSFGLRWSSRVEAPELQQLMRHDDIETTLEFYAIVEATSFAKKLWDQHDDKKKVSRTTPDTTPRRTTR